MGFLLAPQQQKTTTELFIIIIPASIFFNIYKTKTTQASLLKSSEEYEIYEKKNANSKNQSPLISIGILSMYE